MSNLKIMNRKQYLDYLKENPDTTCQFCDYNSRQIVLKETKSWVWIANLAPYWKWHTMFIPKSHIEKIEELKLEEFEELSELKNYAEKTYKEKINPLLEDLIYMFFYFWREREDGFDPHSNIKKPTHLHLHMVPERDGLMNKIVDPDASDFDYTKFL